MKIQFLNGGLANQAFQYIFARYYELSHPGDKMFLDDSYFALHTVHNGYELEKVFGFRPHMLSQCFDEKVWAFILEERQQGKSVPQILREQQAQIQMITETGNYSHFNPFDGEVFPIPSNGYFPEILEVPGNTYYHGYWINKDWFMGYRETFLGEFTFPVITDERNLRYLEEIQTSHSVSVHVRRGDYVTLGWELDLGVYQDGLRRFVEQAQTRGQKDERTSVQEPPQVQGQPQEPPQALGQPQTQVQERPQLQGQMAAHRRASVEDGWHLFVFSDDIDWCREHARQLGFGLFPKITYVEGNVRGENYRDLQLMSQCEGMILSNSAFSYLAALLNTRRRYTLNLSDRVL